MAAAQTPRCVCERSRRRDRARAAIGGVEQDRRGDERRREHLAEQPQGGIAKGADARFEADRKKEAGDESGYKEGAYEESDYESEGAGESSRSALSSSFRSESKLARRKAAFSSTHSTSSTSLSCGSSSPATYSIR